MSLSFLEFSESPTSRVSLRDVKPYGRFTGLLQKRINSSWFAHFQQTPEEVLPRGFGRATGSEGTGRDRRPGRLTLPNNYSYQRWTDRDRIQRYCFWIFLMFWRNLIYKQLEISLINTTVSAYDKNQYDDSSSTLVMDAPLDEVAARRTITIRRMSRNNRWSEDELEAVCF